MARGELHTYFREDEAFALIEMECAWVRTEEVVGDEEKQAPAFNGLIYHAEVFERYPICIRKVPGVPNKERIPFYLNNSGGITEDRREVSVRISTQYGYLGHPTEAKPSFCTS